MFVQIFTIPLLPRCLIASAVKNYGMVFGSCCCVGRRFLPVLATANLVLISVMYFIGLPIIHAALIGPLPSFISEQFSTEERYTGLSLGYQLSSVLGGFTPLIITALMGPSMETTWATVFLVAVFLTSAAILMTLKERRNQELAHV